MQQDSHHTGPIQGVYLIHFKDKLAHAQHYIGCAKDIAARIARHRAGRGARLMRAIVAAGIEWELAQIYPGQDYAFERKLKARHGASRFCPICKALRD